MQVVGSIRRARTICSKARSPPTASPRPRRLWAPCRTSHNNLECLDSTVVLARLVRPGAGSRDSRSSSPWPCQAAIFCRPTSSRAASSVL